MTATTAPQPPAAPSPQADAALKARHRAMWALGDYPAVAREVISMLGPLLVEAAGVGPGMRVLDVAAGSGNAALPAARAGAAVVAADLTPELLEAGRAQAATEGLDVRWQVADAEALPFDDGSFDAVLSCVGVMFAPHHQEAADELLRVCRPGGRLALLSWTPDGFVGRMFATMTPYVAPPPPGAGPPPLWGDEDHVRRLLGDRVTGVAVERRALEVRRFDTPDEFLGFFKASYGPTVAAYRGLADQPDRARRLDDELLTLAAGFTGPAGHMAWEYLLLTATRA